MKAQVRAKVQISSYQIETVLEKCDFFFKKPRRKMVCDRWSHIKILSVLRLISILKVKGL